MWNKALRMAGTAALVIAPAIAHAQNINLTGGNADLIWHGEANNAKAGIWMDQGAVSASDGRADLIIGAPGTTGLLGHVYVIYGGPDRSGDKSLANADAVITGATTGDLFGAATAAGNITNTEGSIPRQLIVAAPNANSGRGIVYVFSGGFGSGASLDAADAVYRIVGRAGDQLGTALATADLNNDGYREIIVGAAGTGRIYFFNGGPGLSGTRQIDVSGADFETAGTGLGGVLAAGDVTGDGISDLLAGSSALNVVYLFKGRAAGGLPTTPDAGFPGEGTGDLAGASIRLGDLDSDGIRDLIIGAPGADGPGDTRPDAGAVYIMWGSAGLASRNLASADVTIHGAAAGARLGSHITSGDINRDTPNDLVMLAPGASGGASELQVFYGSSARSKFGTDVGGGIRVLDLATPDVLDRRIIGDGAVGPIGSAQVFEVTGEGARDIIAAVPTADSSAGTVYFTVSPRMKMSSSTVTFKLNEQGSLTSSVEIRNASSIGITWTAASNRPWLSIGAAVGTAVNTAPGGIPIGVSAAGMAPGTYTGTVTITSTSKHLQMALPVTVTMIVTGTVLAIDTPTSGGVFVQPFVMSGWAIDRMATVNSGISAVHVYAYKNPGSGTPAVFIGAATYGNSRPDVANAFGAQYGNSGYSIAVKGLSPGVYRFVAYAFHTGAGAFTHYATVDAHVRTNGAIGIYGPSNNSVVTSAFEVSGWAIDRAAATGTGVDTVHIYVYPGGTGSGNPGVFIGVASVGWARSDVGAMFGSQFTNSGFHYTVSGLSPGVFDLVAYAHSTVSGAFDIAMVHRITVNANALMGIDLPSPESRVATNFWAAGWAIDRAAASGTGVDTIHIWAYKNPGSGTAPVFLGVASYGTARPDVANLFGSRYTNSGFALNVTSLTPGVYDIVMFAHSTATNSFNNWGVVRTTVQ